MKVFTDTPLAVKRAKAFLEKSNKIHNNKYDYSKVIYKNYNSKVIIVCPVHGDFSTTPCAHTYWKSDCPKCGRETGRRTMVERYGIGYTMQSLNAKEKVNCNLLDRPSSDYTAQDIFIQHATLIHSNKYNYDKVKYVDRNTHVVITCPEHGDYLRTPALHLHRNIGCGLCGDRKASTKRRIGLVEFIRRATKIHGDKYDYSKVNYINTANKVEIICPTHGSFFIRPSDMLSNEQGCKLCGIETSAKVRSWDKNDFIQQANVVHDNKYLYDNTNIVNTLTKVEIICPHHGSFWMLPGNHIHGKQGCTSCFAAMSRNERLISKLLDKWNINYIKQKRFSDCKSPKHSLLRYDFFIPFHNLLIEYDGEYHYKPLRGQLALETTQLHDSIKTQYAKNKGIRLLRIPYHNQESIESLIHYALFTDEQLL